MKRNRSIRKRFFVVAIMSSLPFFIVVLASALFFYASTSGLVKSSVEHSATTLQTMIAKQLEAQIQSYLRSKVETAVDMFGSVITENGANVSGEGVRNIIDELMNVRVGKSGYFYAVDGKGVIRFHPSSSLIGMELANEEPVKQQIEMKNGYLEYMWKNPEEKQPRRKALYMQYIPELDWIITATSYRAEFYDMVDLAAVKEITKNIRIGKTGYSYIINREGIQISHPYITGGNPMGRVTKDEYNELVERMYQVKDGQISYLWRDSDKGRKKEKIVYIKYVKDFDWIVGTSIYKSEITGPMLQILLINIAAASIITLFIFFYILMINRNIGNNIKEINSTLRIAKKGELSVRTGGSDFEELREIGENLNYLLISLEKTTRELEHMNASLEEKVDERTEDLRKAAVQLLDAERQTISAKIIADIAHEISTPVGVALTAASFLNGLLQIGADNKDQFSNTKTFEKIMNSSDITLRNLQKSSDLIQQFKGVAPALIFGGKEKVNIGEQITRSITSLKPLLETKHIDFSIDIPNVTVISDPEIIKLLFVNLIGNSIDHGFKGLGEGKIGIVLESKDNSCRIMYEDNGRGISKKDQQNIFEAFYTTEKKTGKSGLGLSVVRNIVTEILGGTISVSSEENKFCRFDIEFPITRNE